MTARSHSRTRAKFKRRAAEQLREYELEAPVEEVDFNKIAARLVRDGKASRLILGTDALTRTHQEGVRTC